MTKKTKGILFFSFAFVVISALAYFVASHLTEKPNKIEYIVTSTNGAPALESASSGANTVTTFRKGKVVEFDSIVGNWGVIDVNYKPTYVALSGLKPYAAPTGERPGPGQHFSTVTPEDISYTWSTNRIMERMPDIGLLRGKVGNPDLWFWGAAFLLLVCFAIATWAGSDLETWTWEYKMLYLLLILCSVCEVVYITASEEPLSFFSPDLVGWWQAVIRFAAVFVMLQLQLSLVITMLDKVENEAQYSFMVDTTSYVMWGGALAIAGLFVWSIFKSTPEWWYWLAAAAIVLLPLVAMLISAVRGREWEPLLVAAPLYIVCGFALMMSLSAMLIVLIALFVTYLLIRTALMFLGEGTSERKIDGTYHYVFPDGSSSPFNRFSW